MSWEYKRVTTADGERYIEMTRKPGDIRPSFTIRPDWLDQIDAVEVDGINMRDYPDFCDAYISYAEWKDTGEPLTEDDLDWINDNAGDFVYDTVIGYIY